MVTGRWLKISTIILLILQIGTNMAAELNIFKDLDLSSKLDSIKKSQLDETYISALSKKFNGDPKLQLPELPSLPGLPGLPSLPGVPIDVEEIKKIAAIVGVVIHEIIPIITAATANNEENK